MIEVFNCSAFGKEASRLLASLKQGKRSLTDFGIQFRTLAATCQWNSEALTVHFLEGLTAEVKNEIYVNHLVKNQTAWIKSSAWPFNWTQG